MSNIKEQEQLEAEQRRQLGTKVRELRKKKKYTMAHFAESTGISLATLKNIEYGKCSPNAGTMSLVIKALGCSYAELIDAPQESSFQACHPKQVTRYGHWLKALRMDRRLTPEKLAELSGVELDLIVDIEEGRVLYIHKFVDKLLSDVLKCSPKDLIRVLWKGNTPRRYFDMLPQKI